MRCPSCDDLSVAQSNETTAIAVRHQIESMVASGASTADIDQTLVSEYGQTVLLTPPDAGGIPVLWIVPIVVLVGALGGVAVLFWRRSREFGELNRGAHRGRGAGVTHAEHSVEGRPMSAGS